MSQMQKTNLQLPGGKAVGERETGRFRLTYTRYYTYKIDNK